ncbi:WhiB family transcriptional regulator [Streptomyces sp. NPDC059063]|uniref:WhiB family transcriptional regulator n=1 Tax=Streptomyces sp. NPDC059063 TaxID=3346712 RepID=UPI0036979778
MKRYSPRHRPDTLTRATDWHGDAACGPEAAGDDSLWPDIWFVEGDSLGSRYKAQVAKAVCYSCPVRLMCLEGALRRDEKYGIWGGLDVFERQVLLQLRGVRRPGRGGVREEADDGRAPAA